MAIIFKSLTDEIVLQINIIDTIIILYKLFYIQINNDNLIEYASHITTMI